MCQNPALAAKVIAAAKTAGLPVSVKCRLGYSKLEEWEPWITHLFQQNIAALTVHLRTKKEMSKVPAHWELMPKIKVLRDKIAPETLLIGNGDVENRAHGKSLIQKTKIDGIMIGRGVFTNIFTFEKTPQAHTSAELLSILQYHLELFEQTNSTRPYETLKRFFKIYVRDFPGSHELRATLMESKTVSEALKILEHSRPE